MSTINLGPVFLATIITRDLPACVLAYEDFLLAQFSRRGSISTEQAKFWRLPHLAGCAYTVLNNQMGAPFLRIIEDRDAPVHNTLKHTGWMALEIVVQDVDRLAARLDGSPFEVLRPVADLSISDKIRAVQVRGPAGEILYLTQIKDQVPPFELPQARCAVERVFIPVLCTHDRAASLAFYENLSGNKGLEFDTKITVVNQAYGYAIDTNHPVAVLQLAGQSLIEIDEIKAAHTPIARPCSGIFMLSIAANKLPKDAATKTCPTGTKRSFVTRGPCGELIELVQNII